MTVGELKEVLDQFRDDNIVKVVNGTQKISITDPAGFGSDVDLTKKNAH